VNESKGPEIRLLNANEIDVRVQSVSKTRNGTVGAVLLLYKDARVDMKILDEVFGIYGWKRSHELINGNLFCTISIRDKETGEWISKQDVGVESNTEKEKGQASDAFKRAGFNIGIGRELYTAPFIWVELSEDEYYTENVGGKAVIRVRPNVKFTVADIQYSEDRVITSLTLTDKNGNVRFSTNGTAKAPTGRTGRAGASKSAGNTNKPPEENTPASGQQEAPGAMICPSCGGPISQAEKEYSMKKYGQELCRACQRKAK